MWRSGSSRFSPSPRSVRAHVSRAHLGAVRSVDPCERHREPGFKFNTSVIGVVAVLFSCVIRKRPSRATAYRCVRGFASTPSLERPSASFPARVFGRDAFTEGGGESLTRQVALGPALTPRLAREPAIKSCRDAKGDDPGLIVVLHV